MKIRHTREPKKFNLVYRVGGWGPSGAFNCVQDSRKDILQGKGKKTRGCLIIRSARLADIVGYLLIL